MDLIKLPLLASHRIKIILNRQYDTAFNPLLQNKFVIIINVVTYGFKRIDTTFYQSV